MKYIFFTFLFITSTLFSEIVQTYTDNFNTNTIASYATENTWTSGGTGSLTYDSVGKRMHMLTGDNVAMKFSKDVTPSAEGSFSIDFLPTVKYPKGGVFILTLEQDENTYYKIGNSDGYGTFEISKYVNGVNVDTNAFNHEYTQNSNYTITVTFSPSSMTVEAYGESVTLNGNTSAVTVNSFSVELTQQDAYFDNVVYGIAQEGGNTSPIANAGIDKSVQVNESITITGSGSDSDGTITAYQWSKGNTVLANTAIFVYSPISEGIDTLILQVTDNSGSIGTDSMDVSVTALPPVNTAPVANAGVNQSVNTSTTVTLDGSNSTDSDNDILTYQWSLTNKPIGSSALLVESTSKKPTFIADVDGTYMISLVVNDGTKDSVVVSVTITASTSEEIDAFRDNFNTNTIASYATENTWTSGGTGSLTYDSVGKRMHMLTGDNVAMKFSKDVTPSAEGSFSIDFLPTVKYPKGGVFILTLEQDENTYYKIGNSDGYGTFEISKYVNGVNVDTNAFNHEYTQNSNYTITVTFSPSSMTVEAYGESVTLNGNTSAVTVNSFSVELTQQDAYFDNVMYAISAPTNIQFVTLRDNHIQSNRDLSVDVLTVDLATGWGVKFVLDEGSNGEQVIIDSTVPYEATFTNLPLAEYKIDSYIVDEVGNVQPGDENHDSVKNIGIGDILVSLGDSLTFGYGDGILDDDISADGRNTGGGFEPILNDYLSAIHAYPHSIINEGIAGEKTEDGLIRLPSILAKYPEARTFLILYGTNDTNIWSNLESGKGLNIGDSGYAGTYKDYLKQMIELVNSIGKEVAIAKIPFALGESPTSRDYSEPIENGHRNVQAREFNEAIDELIANPSNNISVMSPDLYLYFKNNYVGKYFDNFHPNGLGYQNMAELWRDVLIQ